MTVETSIIITCYNAGRFISQCIESCVNQIGYKKYEIIIVNDCSTDNSKKIIKNYIKKVKIINLKKNLGIEKAANHGIKKSKGKFILRLDADDILYKNYLKEIVKILKNKKIDFIYSDYLVINKNNKILKKMILPNFNVKEIFSRGDFLASGTLYKKKILKKYGFYNTKIKNCGLENYEFILKILINGHKGYKKRKILFMHRRHEKNMSEVKKKSILRYGSLLFKSLNLSKYQIGKYHPSNV